MGLDLIVSVQSDFSTDEQGRNTYKVTQLYNLRGCYNILDKLDERLSNGFSNCATHTFFGETFHEILTELMELKDEEKNNDRKVILEYDIDKLKEFILENNIPNKDEGAYQVHAWW